MHTNTCGGISTACVAVAAPRTLAEGVGEDTGCPRRMDLQYSDHIFSGISDTMAGGATLTTQKHVIAVAYDTVARDPA